MEYEKSKDKKTAEINIELNEKIDGIGKSVAQPNLSESTAESANNKINEFFTKEEETPPIYLTHNTASVQINKED